MKAHRSTPPPAAQTRPGQRRPWWEPRSLQGGGEGSPRTRASGRLRVPGPGRRVAAVGRQLHIQGLTLHRPQEARRRRHGGPRPGACRQRGLDRGLDWPCLQRARPPVAGEEAGSLVSGDRDQRLLWGPRDVHVLRPFPVRVHCPHVQEDGLHLTAVGHGRQLQHRVQRALEVGQLLCGHRRSAPAPPRPPRPRPGSPPAALSRK